MTQAPVALSDFVLAFEATLFAGLINPVRREGPRPIRFTNRTPIRWFELFFYAVAAASVLGGAVHGFVPHPVTVVQRMLWPATLIAVGAGAWAAWGIGACIQFLPAGARRVGWFATAGFLIYAGAIIFDSPAGMRSFRAAIFNYLPAVLFLLTVFVSGYLRRRDPGYLLGALAMLLTLIAATLQQSNLAVEALGLTHNVLYHLIQGCGLLLLFLCARHLTGGRLDHQPLVAADARPRYFCQGRKSETLDEVSDE